MSDRAHKIARALGRAADVGERRALVAELAEAHGVATATIYRWARQGGWSSGRRPRHDAGERRSGLTNDHLDAVAGLVSLSQRADERIVMPVAAAVEVLQANERLPEVSPSTVARLLRERQQAKEQMRAPAVFVSRQCEVGEVMQLDSSPAIAWFLDGEKGIRRRPDKEVWDWHKPETHRKPEARRHLIRYFATDKASGLWSGAYYYTTGETWRETVDTLLSAFALMGVPRAVVLDRGPGNTAWETQMLLWLLGVEVQFKGSSKNTMGAVESVHNRVQQWLESRWHLAPPRTMAEANRMMAAWWVDDTRSAIHTRSGRTRWEMFCELKPGGVRVCPPAEVLLRALHARPAQRSIDGEGIFQFDGHEFLVEGRRIRNRRCWVAYDPWEAPNAVVLVGFDRENLTCEERLPARMLERNALGYFAEMPRWGLGEEHPIGTRQPEHAEGLKRARRAGTALKRDDGVDWYADLGGPSPILATPEAQAIQALVAGRGGEVELAATERPIPSATAIYRAIAAIRERHRREPTESELAVLRSWQEREAVAAEEIQGLVAQGGQAVAATGE